MSSSAEDSDRNEGISHDVAVAVWPLLQKLGETPEHNSPEDFTDEAKAENEKQELIKRNLSRIEVQVYKNHWGLDGLWLTIDAEGEKLTIMGTVSCSGEMEPEEVKEAMDRITNMRNDMIKARYKLSKPAAFDSENYDMYFEKPVDTEDPQKVYAAVDAFIALL